LFIEIYFIIITKKQFSRIFIYISLILIKTITSSLINIQTRVFLVYIIYKPLIVYTYSIDSRTIFGFKPIAKDLIGIYIDSIRNNWFCFNYIKKNLLFKLKLKLFLGKDFFIFFYPELYNAII
jgi:hypothetical protein